MPTFALFGPLRPARRRARALYKETQRLMRRAGGRLAADHAQALSEAMAHLEAAWGGPHVQALIERQARLEMLMGRYLAPYQRAGWLESVESIGSRRSRFLRGR